MPGKIIHTYWTKLLAAAFAFLAVVLTARCLGAEGKGLTSLITTNLLFMSLANEVVGGVSLIYLIPRRQPLALLFSALLFTLIDSLLLAVVFHILQIIPKTYTVHLYLLAVVQTLNNTVLYVLLGRENIEQHNYLFLLKALVNVLMLALFFIVLKNATAEAFIYALYLSNGVPLVMGIVLLFPFLRENFPAGNMVAAAREMFSYGSAAQLANIIQTLNYRLSFYLLNLFVGQKAVGVYSVALALCDVIWMMSKSISTVQLTRIANMDGMEQAHELTRKFLRFSVAGTVLFLVPAMMLPDKLYALVFGTEFSEVRKVIVLMGTGILIFSVNIILANHFAGTGRYQINLAASLVGLAVNAAANLLMIPVWGLAGAAIAASLTLAVITLYTWLRFRRETFLNWKDLLVKTEDMKKLAALARWWQD